jgi:hypothetical protein
MNNLFKRFLVPSLALSAVLVGVVAAPLTVWAQSTDVSTSDATRATDQERQLLTVFQESEVETSLSGNVIRILLPGSVDVAVDYYEAGYGPLTAAGLVAQSLQDYRNSTVRVASYSQTHQGLVLNDEQGAQDARAIAAILMNEGVDISRISFDADESDMEMMPSMETGARRMAILITLDD